MTTTDHPAPPQPSAGDSAPGHRDWLVMSLEDFDVHAGPPRLFELASGQCPADDGHGTLDLLELLD